MRRKEALLRFFPLSERSRPESSTVLVIPGDLFLECVILPAGPFITPIAARYPHQRRKSMWLGAVLCCGTLFGASYATEVGRHFSPIAFSNILSVDLARYQLHGVRESSVRRR